MTNVIHELRKLVPHRPLSGWESLAVAERQAGRLRSLLAITEVAVTDEHLVGLPRIEVVRLQPSPISGSVHWLKGRWLIALNAAEPAVRQRFSLAHEIKHVIDNPFTRFLYPASDSLTAHERGEQAADHFAACLLMPRSLVKRLYFDDRVTDLVQLAARFDVSRKAMQVRLENIGLIDPPLPVTTSLRGAA